MSRCQGLLPRKNHQKTRVVYQGQFTHQKIHQVVATKKSPWNPRSVNATMTIPMYNLDACAGWIIMQNWGESVGIAKWTRTPQANPKSWIGRKCACGTRNCYPLAGRITHLCWRHVVEGPEASKEFLHQHVSRESCNPVMAKKRDTNHEGGDWAVNSLYKSFQASKIVLQILSNSRKITLMRCQRWGDTSVEKGRLYEA